MTSTYPRQSGSRDDSRRDETLTTAQIAERDGLRNIGQTFSEAADGVYSIYICQ